MKTKYIKPEIEIIESCGSQILAGSTSIHGPNTLHHSDSQTDETGPGTGGDEQHEGGDDLDAAKRLFSGGDPLWHGYSPWE